MSEMLILPRVIVPLHPRAEPSEWSAGREKASVAVSKQESKHKEGEALRRRAAYEAARRRVKEGWAEESANSGAGEGAGVKERSPESCTRAAKATSSAPDSSRATASREMQRQLWGGRFAKPSAFLARKFQAEDAREARKRRSAKAIGAFITKSEVAPLIVAKLQNSLSRAIDLFRRADEDG